MIRAELSPDSGRAFVRMANLNGMTREGIRWAFFEIGRDLKNTANTDILKKPKTGKIYIIRSSNGRKRRHRASAPGESHANLTGKLRRSIGWRVRGDTMLRFGYGLQERAPDYAAFVENGTSKMAARPSLENSVKKNLRNAEVHFARSLNRRFEI